MIREIVDKIYNDMFEIYLRYHLGTCERENLVGIISHEIDI